MIELRCDHALHGKLNPERLVLSVKCKSCTRAMGRPVYHHWLIEDILAQYQRGEIGGVCPPTESRFVHWRVTAA